MIPLNQPNTITAAIRDAAGNFIFCNKCDTLTLPETAVSDGETQEGAARRLFRTVTGEAEPAECTRMCMDDVHGTLYYLSYEKPFAPVAGWLASPVLPRTWKTGERTAGQMEYILDMLNRRTAADELWDLYDENRQKTGRLQRRGDDIPAGYYHLVVHVWVQNTDGEYLLTRRDLRKGFGGMWECSGGSAALGDDSLSAAVREVREETGLTLDPSAGKCVYTYLRDNYICDVWMFRAAFSLDEIRLQPGETIDRMTADGETVLRMAEEGTLVPFVYLDTVFGGKEADADGV